MDPAGLLLLEHLNVNVCEWEPTQRFYEAIGCQKVPSKFHMNCGPHTQFHLPVEKPVQLWRGVVTVAYSREGLEATRRRLADLSASCDGIEVAVDGVAVGLQSPWGSFLLREATPAENDFAAVPTSRPNTEVTKANGVVGIVEVTLQVPKGSSSEIVSFYREVFGFEAENLAAETVIVGGPVKGSQRIRFQECEGAEAYQGDHLCIYIGDFEGVFERCLQQELLYVNPRFTHLDDSRSLEQARHFQAFRILNVKRERDLFTEEHEIRSRNHKFISLPRGAATL
eukprot:TRINITY_DN98363_c0_g1_i1.p1 TRINITY_DN98363_c0_g1~~TRINITY_DN98363_c0_g1_i1.p1  ORF type:complete len:283 (+),score=56.02 TRINITY_DN98363_c0_g1_i1:30-878(+)